LRFTLDLTDEQLNNWRNMAKAYGFTIGRGNLAKQGSVQSLMDECLSDNGRLMLRVEKRAASEDGEC